jgi:hypothetical protein
MKTSIIGLLTLVTTFLAPVQVGLAADTINMDVVARVDPYGDGSMKVTFHLSASQWANWRQQYGDHPDVLWRDFKQKFAKCALDKFDLKRNDVDRTATADIEARALTTVRNDGSRGIEILKDFRLVSNSGPEWVFESTSQESPYSPILTQTSRIILPSQATTAHLESPGTSVQQLVYQMPETGNNSLLFWAGILAMVGGILFGILGLLFCFAKESPPLPKPLAPKG